MQDSMNRPVPPSVKIDSGILPQPPEGESADGLHSKVTLSGNSQTSAALARSNDAKAAAPSTQPRTLGHGCEPFPAAGGSGSRKTAATRSAALIDSGTAIGAGAITVLATEPPCSPAPRALPPWPGGACEA